MNTLKKYWHRILIGSIFFCEAIILFVLRENIYVSICDNLDLFITQLKLLHDNYAFFSHGKELPILSGIDRNYFPSEFSVYNILYLILPDIYAYIVGYLLKMLIGFGTSILLAKYLLGQTYGKYEKIVMLVAAAYALLPVYPTYAICFASLPLVVYLLIRIYQEPKLIWYILLFLYPLLSYFSFFGAFILGYLLIASVILWIRDRKCPVSLFTALVVLMLGFVCFEYRLFYIMLFSDEETIRSTMIIASYNRKELWECFKDVFLYGVSHARSAHTYVVLPTCAVYFIYVNVKYFKDGQYKKIISDKFNLAILFILFNCIVYTLYYCEPIRNLVETLIPQLKGFSYGRTAFFNTFGWYFAFFIVLKRLYDIYYNNKKNSIPVIALALAAIAVVGTTQCEYSDFYNTLYCNAYKLVKHTSVNQLSYKEFYAKELFDQIKEDIDYKPQQSACAYALHPAALSYNGITTVDGYCGYYSQSYKETFRQVIEPTLDSVSNWQTYYDNTGYRAYLFSASGENTYDFGANAESTPQEININTPKLKELGCEYIFSRVEITNAEKMQLNFVNYYECEQIPYGIYLYKLN